MSRRAFLRGTGVALALPLLEAMTPLRAARAAMAQPPRRMLGICNNLGVLPEYFFPTGNGRDYPLSPYLELLSGFRDDFTVLSGVSHPGVDGGHPADVCFLTAAPHPGSAGFRNTISLDQYIAERIGPHTRFPSLTLGVNVKQGARSLSWTGGGVLIPCDDKASDVFRRLFVQGTPEAVEAEVSKLRRGQSILDGVYTQAKSLQRDVGPRDRDRLDQYFTSVRELEHRMQLALEWERRPKPNVSRGMPLDPASPRQYMEKVGLMYDLARLAFETDSTRSITLLLDSVNSPAMELQDAKILDGYHNLSHHGKSEAKLNQLKAIDQWHMKLLAKLFGELKSVREANGTMLDHTMIVYGSNLGNANTHSTTNLPVLFAGGGFRHGQHLAFDQTNNYPLANLYVSMLQRMGIETDRFASGTGPMRGLDFA